MQRFIRIIYWLIVFTFCFLFLQDTGQQVIFANVSHEEYCIVDLQWSTTYSIEIATFSKFHDQFHQGNVTVKEIAVPFG